MARAAMRRHQTLFAAIDWSHVLRSAAEQRVYFEIMAGRDGAARARGLADG